MTVLRRALSALYVGALLLCLAAGMNLWHPWGLTPLQAWCVAAAIAALGLLLEWRVTSRPAPAADPPFLNIWWLDFRPLLPSQRKRAADWLHQAYDTDVVGDGYHAQQLSALHLTGGILGAQVDLAAMTVQAVTAAPEYADPVTWPPVPLRGPLPDDLAATLIRIRPTP